MKKIALVFVILLTVATFKAYSQENPEELKSKIPEAANGEVPGEDVDNIITNNLMRAQSGSKSRYSISNSMNYSGGTIQTPLNDMRPNISAGTGNTAVASLTDSLAAKYSLDTQHALSFGLGVRWITPLSGTTNVPSTYNGDKYDAYDPYVKYSYVYKWAGIQNVLTTGVTVTTQNNLTRMGYVGNVILEQNSVYQISNSGFSVGALYYVDLASYNGQVQPFLTQSADYSGGIQPFLEYQLTSRLNLRSYWSLIAWEHLLSEPRALTFYQDTLYSTLGLGISVTRDLFLYPNVNFIPYDIRADRTNVGLSANINLF